MPSTFTPSTSLENVVVSQALKLQNPATKKVSKIFCWLHQSKISNALPDLEEILDFLA